LISVSTPGGKLEGLVACGKDRNTFVALFCAA
jgi:hypothetical protein